MDLRNNPIKPNQIVTHSDVFTFYSQLVTVGQLASSNNIIIIYAFVAAYLIIMGR